jgi:uncharacterized protein DUF6515
MKPQSHRPTAVALLMLIALSVLAGAAEARDAHRGYVFDNRYNHGHYYPERGAAFRALPPGGYRVPYRGGDYYFHGGAWYRPWGPRFLVVAPPFGIGIRFLPPFYTTVWFGGLPYYYADGTYYLWRPERQEYVVSTPPPDSASASTSAPTSPELYAYPKNGQSDAQQSTDRYECHRWASNQSGFDPTEPLGGVAAADAEARRADYTRAQKTCLEGRGYSVN